METTECRIKPESVAEEAMPHQKALHKKFIQLLLTLLCSARLPEELPIEAELRNDPDFQKLYNYILSLRELSAALHGGDLQRLVSGKGFILANLKALQSNLRHLSWQTKKVAEGDFSHKVDFLGEFSDAFNEMTARLRDTNSQLVRLASEDTLTQVFNRLALDRFLSAAFAEAREQERALSVLLFDIDHFKKVNDSFGHHAGDQVLIQISQVLKKQFRSADMLARYGGEEFIAVLPETGTKQAVVIGTRALNAVRKAVVQMDAAQTLSVTVSIGVSEIRTEDTSYEELLKRCDRALYEAKNSGRNRLCVL